MKIIYGAIIALVAVSSIALVGCTSDDSKSQQSLKGPAPTPGKVPPGAKNPEQRALDAAKASGDTGGDGK